MKKTGNIGYFYLLPLLLLVCVFLIYPFVNGIVLSFFYTKYGFGEMNFAGFANYFNVLKDSILCIAAKNSLIWVLVSLVLNLIVPLVIALMLNRPFRGKNFVIMAMLISWFTPVVGFAMMNKWLLDPEVGIVSTILKGLGLVNQGINFIGSISLALPTVIVLNAWQFCPFGVLLLLSVLSVIPEELYDSMKIDGASSWKIFIYLILPLIGSMIGFLLFLGLVWVFNNYSLVYILTQGGPAYSTYTIPMMIYEKGFAQFNVGQSVALASMVGAFLILLGFLYFKYLYKPVEI